MRIDKFTRERSNKYIPGHKQFIQLFKRHPEGDEIEYREVGQVVEEVIVKYAYEMEQILYNVAWEQEKVIVDGEEVFLSVGEYIDKHFDEIWDGA